MRLCLTKRVANSALLATNIFHKSLSLLLLLAASCTLIACVKQNISIASSFRPNWIITNAFIAYSVWLIKSFRVGNGQAGAQWLNRMKMGVAYFFFCLFLIAVHASLCHTYTRIQNGSLVQHLQHLYGICNSVYLIISRLRRARLWKFHIELCSFHATVILLHRKIFRMTSAFRADEYNERDGR